MRHDLTLEDPALALLVTVVDVERQTNELRQDGGTARPGFDRLGATSVLGGLGLLQKAELDERTFPDGTSHVGLPLLLRVARTDDHLVRLLVLAGTGALGRLTPRSDRVTATTGTAFTTTMRVVDR